MVVPVVRIRVLSAGLSVTMRMYCAFAPVASPNTATTRNSVVRNRLSMVSNLRRIGNLGCEGSASSAPPLLLPHPAHPGSGLETRNLGFFVFTTPKEMPASVPASALRFTTPFSLMGFRRPCCASSREAGRGRGILAAAPPPRALYCPPTELLQDRDRVLEDPIGRRSTHEVDAGSQLLTSLATAIDRRLVDSRRHERLVYDRPHQPSLNVEQLHLHAPGLLGHVGERRRRIEWIG